MAESVTISRKEPALKSMNYTFLRERGIEHIQRLAGKLWTNFNNSDPGLTILEVLSYAITDLGYRSSYEIKDLLAADPSDPASANIRNFFTASQILPNSAVTINDYRKLLMDVDVHDPLDIGAEFAGVKNAWIECSEESEKDLYVWRKQSKLDYIKDPANEEKLHLEVLYNILIELGECDKFGDLNENTQEGTVTLYSPPSCGSLDPDLVGKKVILEIEFPRWDDPVNWEDLNEIRRNSRGITLTFVDLPSGYRVQQYELDPVSKEVRVTMTNFQLGVDTTCIETVLNDFIYYGTNALINQYQQKVKKILQIIDKVRATFMANRNLCEDLFRIQALKVEEIAVCADVELLPEADVEATLAKIYHELARFLSPTVFFYDLEEMFAKGKTSEEIFEGPRLAHGFIDDEELKKADRRKSIHVSDLISIIMDIPGVTAVKSIKIGNIPLDNDDNIKQVTVRWCLDLAFEYGYVPRLSIDRSSFTFFKGQLPYKANDAEVEKLLEELKDNAREQKIHSANLTLDIPVPEGVFREAGDYTSIQDEFPLVYGIGYEGLPVTATDLRKAQAKQLKGFLMFFDQLLANYLTQLAHVNELFALNDERDAAGDYIINRSYFTQNLISIVPDAAPLYVNQTGHKDRMDQMAENTNLFESRRNKFLDHLMARFSEQFTDYALLSYKVTGAKTPEELIEDKLAFLNAYPEISSGRDKAFNYEDPCRLWHVDNASGLEKRVSLLAGIDARTAGNLIFTGSINIYQTTAGYVFDIIDTLTTAQTVVLSSVKACATEGEAKLAAEEAIINGVQTDRYKVIDSNNKIVDDFNHNPVGPYYIAVTCDTEAIAKTPASYSTSALAEADMQNLKNEAMPVLENEFYSNPESNRNNRACILENYMDVSSVTAILSPPSYSFSYTLYNSPFDFGPGNTALLTGTYTGKGQTGDTNQQLIDKGEAVKHDALFNVLRHALDIDNYFFKTIGTNTQVFDILDRCSDILATSVETNFNEAIRASIPASIVVEGSTGNDNTTSLPSYTVLQAFRDNRNIIIEVQETLASEIPDGFVVYDESFAITGTSQANRTFSVSTDISRRLFPGESIQVTGSGANNGSYTVTAVKWNGTQSVITVSERISSPTVAGTIYYTKKFQVIGADTGTNGNFLTIIPRADEVAAAEMAALIRAKFFSNEGFHVVEHILLRPKVNEDIYLRLNTLNGLMLPTTSTSSLGSANYTKVVPISNIVSSNKIALQGNFVSELPFNTVLTISGSNQGYNDKKYKVLSAALVGLETHVTLLTPLSDTSTPYGAARYRNTMPIDQVIDYNMFSITESPEFIYESDPVIIFGATDTENNGNFLISAVTTNGDITISHRLGLVQDALLPINMNADCEECRITDPYSFVASIVIPYWPGRFTNMDFRRFFERTLHLEAPAHLALNICWVSCKQMEEFEEKYKRWLVENAKREKDKVALSKALGELIDILVRLRSVYPPGTLHDCETDPQLKNSIILNNSVIGNRNF